MLKLHWLLLVFAWLLVSLPSYSEEPLTKAEILQVLDETDKALQTAETSLKETSQEVVNLKQIQSHSEKIIQKQEDLQIVSDQVLIQRSKLLDQRETNLENSEKELKNNQMTTFFDRAYLFLKGMFAGAFTLFLYGLQSGVFVL